MPVNSPQDYFPREIALDILTSCDTFQPIKLHYTHPKIIYDNIQLMTVNSFMQFVCYIGKFMGWDIQQTRRI